MKPATIKLNRMYGDIAHLWPLISPPEDYAAESLQLRRCFVLSCRP